VAITGFRGADAFYLSRVHPYPFPAGLKPVKLFVFFSCFFPVSFAVKVPYYLPPFFFNDRVAEWFLRKAIGVSC
jgi:hypothetical protein